MQFRIVLAALVLAPAVLAMDMGEMPQPLDLHFGGDVNGGKRFGNSSAPSAFALGVVDTMIHGRLSREFSVLVEVAYEASGDSFGFDVERLMLKFEPTTWFQVSVGRFHTPLGYWNTAYHHARWMYSATEAPLLDRFEDDAGPLPAHTIGVLVHGALLPAGPVRFEYDLCAGNARGPRPDPPQNFGDTSDSKSACAALHAEISGVRFGISGSIDSATVSPGLDLRERIAVADLHWRMGPWEAIAEGALIHHDLGGAIANNLGGYAQLAVEVRDDVQLYGRVERFVRATQESYLDTPTASFALGGVRYDVISTAALKLEGGWEKIAGAEGTTIRGQLAWLF